MLHWANLPIVWLVKVGTNITWEELFALEDVGFPSKTMGGHVTTSLYGTWVQ